jgi:hypothetical protein
VQVCCAGCGTMLVPRCCRGGKMRGSGESSVRRRTRARRARRARRGAHGARVGAGNTPAHLLQSILGLFFLGGTGVKKHLKLQRKYEAELAGAFRGGVRSSPSGPWRLWLAARSRRALAHPSPLVRWGAERPRCPISAPVRPGGLHVRAEPAAASE